MHFRQLLLLNFAVAAPAALGADVNAVGVPDKRQIPVFPIPQIGESLIDYAESLIAFFAHVGTDFIPLELLGELSPRLSIDFNLDFLKAVSKTDDVPNYNTNFDPVEGVESSRIKWYTEANNRSSDDPVLIYLHGGAYIMGLNPVFMAYIQDVWKQFNTKSDRLSILVLDYSLAFEKPYPQPLIELASVYNQLLKSCNNVILGGDSAGGHMILNFLRHIKYPVDNVPQVTSKPSGMYAVSPAVNMYPATANGTYKTNFDWDYVSASAIRGMGHAYVPDYDTRISSPLNPWKDYIDWKEVLPDYNKVFTGYGDHEVLRGDIETWLDISGVRNSSATIYGETNGIHDDLALGTNRSQYFFSLVDFLVKNWA